MLYLIHKIAVFRALQLGDMLCAVPAFRALRAAFPAAHISLIGLPWAEAFVKRFAAYIDELIVFPAYPGLPEQQPVDPEKVMAFIQQMQAHRFDLLLQMQGNGNIVNPLMEKLGAGIVAGFCQSDKYCPDTCTFIRYPDHLSEVQRHLRLMEHLNIPLKGEELEFPLTEEDYDDFRKLDLPYGSGEYICVHPGSRGATRQWPPAYFASLADHFAGRGWSIVITGTASEAGLAAQVQSMMHANAVNLAGKTSLGGLAVLIRQAGALFSNCTGVSHLAAAVKTRSVIISMDGEPLRWAPSDKRLHHMVDWTKEQNYETVVQEANAVLEGV
ncbi:glycosyltransferase family 9 protein [Chitinophaga cymbidii]|uniref:LPS biosynthesis-related glycosyltransferase n=1 Tax=Chitinophaga cymbidii TaxID=1096750 RepID=A0A512RKF2_9BACT|nr:glycosyltransferase family 9 protein [Chitinophaga cymbidii]GEP96191.1 LPS biosynthesis-related glycosyltransferase [Chitinophaga cymbidii]